MKKTFTIGIIFLFLFSTLPIVTSTDFDKNSEKKLLNTNNSIDFIIIITYGSIMYHGVTIIDTMSCYNVTPINVKRIIITKTYGMPIDVNYSKITDDPFYIFKEFNHGFINEKYMFMVGGVLG